MGLHLKGSRTRILSGGEIAPKWAKSWFLDWKMKKKTFLYKAQYIHLAHKRYCMSVILKFYGGEIRKNVSKKTFKGE